MPHPEQLRILIILVPTILLVLGIWKPVYAVTAYMVLVYCKAAHYYPILDQFRGELVFGLLILLRIFFCKNFSKRLSGSSDLINKYLYYFIMSVVVSFVIAWDWQYSWDNAVYHFIKTLILYLMIVGGIDSRKDLQFFVYSFVGMFVFLAYVPAYGFLTETGGIEYSYGVNYIADVGILAGHVALANNMNQMLPIGWFLFVGCKGKIGRLLIAVAMLVFLLGLVGSASRGGMVGLAVFAVSVVYFSKKRLQVGLVVMMAFAVLLLGSLGANISHTVSRIDDTSIWGRFTGLTHGVEMVKRGNILGVGPGCFLFARSRYFNYRMESHNIYGQIMGDLGIPGMIIWFLFMRQVFRSICYVKQKSYEKNNEHDLFYYTMLGVQVSLIVRLAISFASHGLYYFYWYVLAGIVVVSRRIVNEEEEAMAFV